MAFSLNKPLRNFKKLRLYSIRSPSSFGFCVLDASNPPGGTPGEGGFGAPEGGIGAPGAPGMAGLGGMGGAAGLGATEVFIPSTESISRIPGGGAVGFTVVGTTLGAAGAPGIGGAAGLGITGAAAAGA